MSENYKIFVIYFVNNFLKNNERRIETSKDYSGQRLRQHTSKSTSSEDDLLFSIITVLKNKFFFLEFALGIAFIAIIELFLMFEIV